MTAELKLNLGDALNQEELRELLTIADEQQKPLERILFEAAKAAVKQAAAKMGSKGPAMATA